MTTARALVACAALVLLGAAALPGAAAGVLSRPSAIRGCIAGGPPTLVPCLVIRAALLKGRPVIYATHVSPTTLALPGGNDIGAARQVPCNRNRPTHPAR